MTNEFKWSLGDKVKDKVTGYSGIIICLSKWLYGCRRYVVQSQEMKDGKPVEAMTFDEDSLDMIEAVAQPDKIRKTGGPTREVSRGRTVSR